MAVSISQVRFEHHRQAIGIAEAEPRISWRFEGDARDWTQQFYEVEIKHSKDLPLQTYKVESPNSVLVPWPGHPLISGQSATVRVRVFDHYGEGSKWSDPAVVETGLLNREDWTCFLITPSQQRDVSTPKQPVIFRRTFSVSASIQTARLYITAHGVYEAHLNGTRIGDHVFGPGWTSYAHRLAYQTFDVTELLQPGLNVLSAEVGEGWFCGRLGFSGGKSNIWGDTIGLIAKLVLSLPDGTETVINTDSQWKSSTGALVTSELYDGEVCDLSLEQKGWQDAEFDDSFWPKVNTLSLPAAELVSPDGPPVRKIEELKAISYFKTPSGKTVVDFGQNIVGWVRMYLSGPKGHIIKLLFTEVLENGEAAERPLRDCKATDTIIMAGEHCIWEPKFTFHGFRYVQVDGLVGDEENILEHMTAVVLHTDMEQTGWFDCSNPLLNQLHSKYNLSNIAFNWNTN